jgi:hypothetical protein
MKYIITESKLENVVRKYLDSHDFIIMDNGKKFNNYIYFLNSESDDTAQISVYHLNAFGEVRDWLYVSRELIELVTLFLPIPKSKLLKVIADWVGDKLNLKINYDDVNDTGNGDMSYRLIVK